MYQTFKKVALTVVPRKTLFKNEVFIRSLFAFHLKGKNHRCSLCKKNLKKFIKIPDGDILCPFCGSRSRTRRLYNFLLENNLLQGKVLHFSPSRSLYRIFSKNDDITYYSTDFQDEFIAEYNYNITNIPVKNNSFDLIICYHILEHIEDDKAAMSELSRVLKKGGNCIIQTPFKVGKIYEDVSKTTKAERLKAFGQEDHVRVYSVEGLKERLLQNGFANVEIKNFSKNIFNGFMNETILIAKK
ncbi:MAG: SAM-dependent methyltransferase [Aequorivita sp.]|nr:SAM-dependent methyltransferase [Aequorivita sp.]|tara:strand:+ start:24972 stop:25700 length:729 start_codon:yes stop_codon:yes gene_type:complete